MNGGSPTRFEECPTGRFDGFSTVLIAIGVICYLFVLGWLAGSFSERSDRPSRANHVDALTDQLAIIQTTNPKSLALTICSFPRGTIQPEQLHRVRHPDGSGDVLSQRSYTGLGFLDMADVQRVESLVRRFLIATTAGSTP